MQWYHAQSGASLQAVAATRARAALLPALLLCAAACATGCSRQPASAPPGAPPAVYHVALVDEIAAHTASPGGAPGIQLLKTKKYLLIYFAARWSDDSRALTAKLAGFHNEVSQNGDDDLGVLYVPTDRKQSDANDFMQETAISWPGVRANTPGAAALRKRYAGPGAPCLVLLDENDNVLSSSYDESGKYLSTRPITAYQKLKDPPRKKNRDKNKAAK